MRLNLLYAFLFSLVFQATFCQTVSLDTTFGNNGKVLTSFPNLNSGILSSAVQSDGKIIVCGFRNLAINFQTLDTVIARYNSDGILDLSFGTNGFIFINGLFIDGTAPKMLLLQSDGKIVVTGSNFTSGSNSGLDFHTYRFNPNGTPDTSFGNNGIVVTDINNSTDESTSILLQSDNKLLVLGTYSTQTNIRFLCGVRYNVDGSIDSSFGVDGKALFGSIAANYSNQLMDVILESNGKIVLGARHDIDGGPGNFLLAKLNANGTIDTGFGTNGARVTNFGADDVLMSIQKINGKYYAFGFSSSAENVAQMAISRYSTTGSLDFSFGTNGKVVLNKSANSQFDVITNANLVGDKILCVGYGENENQSLPFNSDAMLIRLNLDGSIDSTFNTNGYVLSDFSNNQSDVFTTLEVLSDGKILTLGSSDVSNLENILLARFVVSTLETTQNPETSFKIYPNPFTNTLTIESNEINFSDSKIELYDSTGRKLDDLLVENGNSVTLPINLNLAKGNYILKVCSGLKQETFKIIKQ